MPRNYLKGQSKRSYAYYKFEQKEKAAEAVLKGLSLRAAEEEFGVPRATINRFLRKKNLNKIGRPPVFSEQEEAIITECIALSGDWGFPLTKFDIRYLVKAHLDRKGVKEPRFNNNLPGPDWVTSYLKRNRSSLTQRLSQNIKRARAAVDENIINEYFDQLENSLKDVEPSAIVNYDETNLTDDPKREKVIVRRAIRHPEKIMDSSKTSTSVMFSCAADGTVLPVYINYKAEHLYNTWTMGGPPGSLYNRSKSGWFTMETFEDWFRSVIIPYFKKFDKDKPKVVIGDNLASHISKWVLDKCLEINIRFILLPPNSTGLCQPLDVAFFRPLKSHWSKVITNWKMKNRGTIPKDTFPRLLKTCLEEMNCKSADNVKAGFRGSGIVPLNRNQVLKRLPSNLKKQAEDGERNEREWVESFKIYLKDSREQETQPKRLMKKKRHNIKPGACVTNAEFEIDTSEREVICEKPNLPKSKTGRTGFDSDTSVSEIMSLHDDSDIDFVTLEDEGSEIDCETSILQHIPRNYQDQPSCSSSFNKQVDSDEMYNIDVKDEDNMSEIKEGDFLIAKFMYNAASKKAVQKNFVGQVLTSVQDSHLLVKFMRKSAKSLNTFVFPQVDDEQLILPEHVVTKVKPKNITRGRHVFHKDISKYNCS